MEIIPAIDLLNGICVRLNQGNYGKVTQFNEDPLAQALSWQAQGATRLHLVDLDGAKSGKPVNDSSIKDIASALDIPVQLGGGVRSADRAEALIELGVDKVILGTLAIEQPKLIKALAKKHPDRIIVGIDAKKGKVATQGWLKQSEVLATDLARDFDNSDIASIISTDIETDGTLAGPNLEAMRSVAQATDKPVIASGGVGCMSDLLSLLSLEMLGVTGVIIGRALYDGRIDLNEAIKAFDHDQMQDFPSDISPVA